MVVVFAPARFTTIITEVKRASKRLILKDLVNLNILTIVMGFEKVIRTNKSERKGYKKVSKQYEKPIPGMKVIGNKMDLSFNCDSRRDLNELKSRTQRKKPIIPRFKL